jgi:hypothetical protein
VLPAAAAFPVPVIRSFVTSPFGGGPVGSVTTGLRESGEGGFGVAAVLVEVVEGVDEVVLAVDAVEGAVAPADGAS